MAKSAKSVKESKTSERSKKKNNFNNNIKCIVPMPGRGSWHRQTPQMSLMQIHRFSHGTDDVALEEFQAHFLMEREYLVD